eukprot:CFRG3822T1
MESSRFDISQSLGTLEKSDLLTSGMSNMLLGREKTPIGSRSLSETSTVHGRPYSLIDDYTNNIPYNLSLPIGAHSFSTHHHHQHVSHTSPQQQHTLSVTQQQQLMSQQQQSHNPSAISSEEWTMDPSICAPLMTSEPQRPFGSASMPIAMSMPMHLVPPMSVPALMPTMSPAAGMWTLQPVHHIGHQLHKNSVIRQRTSPIPIKSKAAADGSSGCEKPSEDTHRKIRKRRGFKELVRNIECAYHGCSRVYATESSLQTHIRLKHNNIRPNGYDKTKKKVIKRTMSSPLLTNFSESEDGLLQMECKVSGKLDRSTGPMDCDVSGSTQSGLQSQVNNDNNEPLGINLHLTRNISVNSFTLKSQMSDLNMEMDSDVGNIDTSMLVENHGNMHRRHSMIHLGNIKPMWDFSETSETFASLFDFQEMHDISPLTSTQGNAQLDGIPEIASPETLFSDHHDLKVLDMIMSEPFNIEGMELSHSDTFPPLCSDMGNLLNSAD